MPIRTTQLKPAYRARQQNYGFRLHSGHIRLSDRYSFKLAGQALEVSDTKYVRIDRPGQVLFFGSHHSGAVLYTAQAQVEGVVSGQERFAHLDLGYHPDNIPLSARAKVSQGLPLDQEASRLLKQEFVSGANYVTALARMFLEMRFDFIHPDDAFRGPADWEGMKFDRFASIYELDQALDSNDIASVDLDMFTSCRTREAQQELMQRIVDLVRPSKLAMFFTSPGWVQPTSANRYLQGLADQLIME